MRAQQRLGVLEEVPLVEAKTLAMQDRVWDGFRRWLSNSLTRGAFRSAMAQPCLPVLLARGFGNHFYAIGKLLYVFRRL